MGIVLSGVLSRLEEYRNRCNVDGRAVRNMVSLIRSLTVKGVVDVDVDDCEVVTTRQDWSDLE